MATVALGTDGKASLTTSALSVGTHAITAAYNGSANQNPSTSTALNQVVKYASTTALTSSPNPAANGDTIDFTAKVAPVSPGTATPTGTVKFTFGDGQAVTVGVVNGAATAQHYYRNPSIYQVTATYNGSTIYLTSSSPPISQQVT